MYPVDSQANGAIFRSLAITKHLHVECSKELRCCFSFFLAHLPFLWSRIVLVVVPGVFWKQQQFSTEVISLMAQDGRARLAQALLPLFPGSYYFSVPRGILIVSIISHRSVNDFLLLYFFVLFQPAHLARMRATTIMIALMTVRRHRSDSIKSIINPPIKQTH